MIVPYTRHYYFEHTNEQEVLYTYQYIEGAEELYSETTATALGEARCIFYYVFPKKKKKKGRKKGRKETKRKQKKALKRERKGNFRKGRFERITRARNENDKSYIVLLLRLNNIQASSVGVFDI